MKYGRVLTLLAFASLAVACSSEEAPATLPFAAPDGIKELVDQPWGPLVGWDSSVAVYSVVDGGNGLLALGVADETGVLVTHDGSSEWRSHPLAENIQPRAVHVSDDAFIVSTATMIMESSDGTQWQTSVDATEEFGHLREARPYLWNRDGTTVFELLNDSATVAAWTSTSIGDWQRVEPETVTVPRGAHNDLQKMQPTRSIDGPDGVTVTHVARGQHHRKGPALAFLAGDEWTIARPFERVDEASEVRSILHYFWSTTLERYVAIGNGALPVDRSKIYTSTSADGVEWTVERLASPWGTDVPQFADSGDRLYAFRNEHSGETLRTAMWSTQDLVAWNSGELDTTVDELLTLGDGLCLATTFDFDGTDILTDLYAGNCPIGQTVRPNISLVGGASLATQTETWDGAVEQAYRAIGEHDASLPLFGFLAEMGCNGFLEGASASDVRTANADEFAAAVQLESSCDLLPDLMNRPIGASTASTWDEMIDRRHGAIHHQRMSRAAFDAAAADECSSETNEFELAVGIRYNVAEREQLLTIHEHDCHLLSTRSAPDWGGTILASAIADGGEDREIVLLSAGRPVESSVLTDNDGYDHRGSFSPDGSTIAWTSEVDSGIALLRMNADGSAVSVIADDGRYSGRPSWSPDGSRIVYETEIDGRSGIAIRNADGTGHIVLEDGAEGSFALGYEGYDSAWSPEGTHVVYYGGSDSADDLFLFEVSTGERTQLTTNEDSTDATWSPDGTRIAFIGPGTHDGDRADIWMVDITSEEPAYRLYDIPGTQTDVTWSPVDDRLAFVTMSSPDEKLVEQVFMATLETGEVVQMTTDPLGASWPVWSPTGEQIAYIRNVSAGGIGDADVNSSVAIVAMDGSISLTGIRATALDWKE